MTQKENARPVGGGSGVVFPKGNRNVATKRPQYAIAEKGFQEAAHKTAPVRCRACDRIVKRRSRQQIYCSPKCMRRANDELKKQPRSPHSGLIPNPPKLSNRNNVVRGQKSGSSLFYNGPLNLLGGGSWRWPHAGTLDAKTFSKIRWCEVGGELLAAFSESLAE